MTDEPPKKLSLELGLTVPGLSLDPNEIEGHRLHDEIWESETEDFLDRLGVGPGARVLDWGCGFGFDLPRLARRVGLAGEVVGVEPHPLWAAECRKLVQRLGLKRTRVVLGDPGVEPVPEGYYDAVFCSWKASTSAASPQASPNEPALRALLKRARSLLTPEGRIGVMELHHEGIRMYPYSPAIERLLAALRESYRRAGLGTALSCQLPGEFVANGFMFESAWPRQKADAPGSSTYRYMEKVLQEQGPRLVREELLDDQDLSSFQQEWELRRIDPKTLVFTPQVVGIVGRPIGP